MEEEEGGGPGSWVIEYLLDPVMKRERLIQEIFSGRNHADTRIN